MGKYIAFDLETTGLNPQKHLILSGYFVIVEFFEGTYTILDELSLKIKQESINDYIYEEKALEINGINLEEHTTSPDSITEEQAIDTLCTFIIKNNASKLPILGQNVHFDISFLQSLYTSHGVTYPLYHRTVDLMSVWKYKQERKDIPPTVGLRLQNMCEYFSIPYENAHDAKADVGFTLDVYNKLLQE